MASLSQQKQVESQGPPQFSILVCGKTGIGKSTLINFILGEDVCEVGDPGAFGGVFKPITKRVEGHEVDMNGVQVIIFDSPGLQDGTGNDEEYLADMYAKCRDVSLVFYCHDMPNPRWTDHEVNAIRLLTEKFGPTFWDKAILVLTKANMVQPTKPLTEEQRREHFKNWTVNSAKTFQDEVQKQLQQHAEAGEIQQRLDSIPVVPTGSDAVQILPNGKHFIGNLWVNCLERITNSYLSEIFMQATNVEGRLVTQEEIEREGPSLGITFEGLMTAGSSLTEYVAPIMKETLPKLPKPTKQLVAQQFHPQLTTQPSGTQQQPTVMNITYNITQHVHPPPEPKPLAQEPKLLAQDPKPLPSHEEELDPSSKIPKYPMIVDNSEAERIKLNLDKKVKEIMEWVTQGAAVGAAVGGIVPAVGIVVGAAVGVVVGGISCWLKDRISKECD